MFSIIIPTYNRSQALDFCLKQIEKSTCLIDVPFEVIVSDDSTNSDTELLIKNRYQWINYQKGPRKGPAANRNNGFKNSTYDWIVFLDDDCIPNEEILLEYYKCLNDNPNIYAFEGKIYPDRERERFDEVAPINLDGGKFWSCNIMVNKKVFTEVGGFDERFPYAAMEDIDFYQRIFKLYKVSFADKAFVVHPWKRLNDMRFIKQHFISNKIYNKKYGIDNVIVFSITRFKILISNMVKDFKELFRYKFKGFKFYLNKCILNFLLIFSF